MTAAETADPTVPVAGPPPLSPAASTDPESMIRASNREREETVARLHDALGEGRLDLAETDRRVTAAYAAQHRRDLVPLLTDLPASRAPQTVAPELTAIWTATVWRLRILVWGSSSRGSTPPTAGQCRTAAVLVVAAAAWVILCMVVGAAVVGS